VAVTEIPECRDACVTVRPTKLGIDEHPIRYADDENIGPARRVILHFVQEADQLAQFGNVGAANGEIADFCAGNQRLHRRLLEADKCIRRPKEQHFLFGNIKNVTGKKHMFRGGQVRRRAGGPKIQPADIGRVRHYNERDLKHTGV
jgi:hypothetical protein